MKKNKLTPHRKRNAIFLKIVSAAISLFAISLILCACATGNTVSQKQATENLEKVFGDIKELPMDIERVKKYLGEETIVSTEKKEESKDSTGIFVGNGVVLYHSVSESASWTQTGYDYTYTIEIMHFGGAEIKGNDCNMHFTGANIKMDIEADDPAAVRQELLGAVDKMDFSENDLSLMKELINGKQIFVSNDSQLWDMYAEVDTDVELTYDTESESFLAKIEDGYDEMYDQYSYDIVDFKGRVKERVYYKVDEDGTEWITENYHYTYLPDGTLKEHSVVYYDYTTQVWMENEHIEFPDTTWRTLWSRSYNSDGVLESEMYFDESGNQVGFEYFSDGSVYTKKILEGIQVDGDTGREIYSEEYGFPGVLFEKKFVEDDILTWEYYFDNGNIQERRLIDLTHNFIIEQVNGFEDGSKNVFTFYDNGEEKVFKSYDQNGMLHQETRYMIDGKPEFEAYYHDNGKISYTNEYYKDGTKKKMGEYDKNGDPLVIITYYENGEKNVEEQYHDGSMWLKIEYYEDGAKKKITEYDEDGRVVNVENYDA